MQQLMAKTTYQMTGAYIGKPMFACGFCATTLYAPIYGNDTDNGKGRRRRLQNIDHAAGW